MRTQRFFRGMIFLVTLASFLFAAALPQDIVFAEDVVRLTIENDSDRDIWLKLTGPAYYYLHVRAGETKSYTPLKGVYDYTYYACGTFVKGEIDLNTQKTIEVPDCGYKAHAGQQDPEDTLDGGKMLNLVNFTIENDTGGYMTMILTGPSVYVFTFKPDQEREFTIPMGYYNYTAYGCGGSFNGTLYAHFNRVKEIDCP
ncbi:MAG: hypothetical protein FJ010_03540 [Chloroflexi bacterium]|nr:hypothetical protein [Chloroflexota bacterium]